MNLELQGESKCIAEMMRTVSSYSSKFELMKADLTNNTSDHLQDHLDKCPNFASQTQEHVTENCSLFQDFGNILPKN
jgi:hypothetical protein